MIEIIFLLTILVIIIFFYKFNEKFRENADYVYNTLTPLDYKFINRPIDYKKYLADLYAPYLNEQENNNFKPKEEEITYAKTDANQETKPIVYKFDELNNNKKQLKVKNYCNGGNRHELELCAINDLL